MLKIVLISFAAVVAVLLVIIALRPSQFRVARTATVSAPPSTVFAQVNDLHNLDFLKPFASTCAAEFVFLARGDQTAVTWSMTGRNNFMSKAMGLFMDCEKMVGGQFEQGLAQMKSVAAAAGQPNAVTQR